MALREVGLIERPLQTFFTASSCYIMAVSSHLRVPLLDLKAQYETIRDEIRSTLDRVLESQHFILGPEVEALERDVAAYSQCRFGIGVSSGTDALLVALMAIGLRPGDEVITTPYTFFATAGGVSRLGGVPVFVDIKPETFNIDPNQIESRLSPRTRAIIPVHLFGQVADMDAIMDIASRRDVHVIEDAAQAIGAEHKGRRAGSIGHLGCFSFYPTKNLGGFGDGGMVTTNDQDLAERIKLLRAHGIRSRYRSEVVGGNFRLDEIQAAVLRVKLKHLDKWTEGRRRNAGLYRKLFDARWLSLHPELSLPADDSAGRHIYNQFVIRHKKRDGLMNHLRDKGIGSEIYYPEALHLQECFKPLGGKPGDFPQSELAATEALALPIYPELTNEMLSYVVSSVKEFSPRPV
jgi:dTDP-4-amino-4,6-dideoxygalactose transaminase